MVFEIGTKIFYNFFLVICLLIGCFIDFGYAIFEHVYILVVEFEYRALSLQAYHFQVGNVTHVAQPTVRVPCYTFQSNLI